MATGFLPGEFMSKAETMGGLSRRWKFSVSITPPRSLFNSVPTGKIDFLAISVSMPEKSMATTEQRIYGINKTVPYETAYAPVLLTMLNPQDWSTRKFWDEWLDHIQNPGSKNMTYYKSMIGQIEISHYDETTTEMNPSNARYTVVLNEAWPERITPYALGWEAAEFGNFEIAIRYKTWHEKGTNRHNAARDAGTTKTFKTVIRAHSAADLARKLKTQEAGNVE